MRARRKTKLGKEAGSFLVVVYNFSLLCSVQIHIFAKVLHMDSIHMYGMQG